LRRLLVSYVFAASLSASLRCQTRSVAGVIGKTSAQRLRGISRASAASQTRAARLVTYPAGAAVQHRVLVPESQQFGIFRQVRAGYQDG
jgi:hypothetical protein